MYIKKNLVCSRDDNTDDYDSDESKSTVSIDFSKFTVYVQVVYDETIITETIKKKIQNYPQHPAAQSQYLNWSAKFRCEYFDQGSETFFKNKFYTAKQYTVAIYQTKEVQNAY